MIWITIELEWCYTNTICDRNYITHSIFKGDSKIVYKVLTQNVDPLSVIGHLIKDAKFILWIIPSFMQGGRATLPSLELRRARHSSHLLVWMEFAPPNVL